MQLIDIMVSYNLGRGEPIVTPRKNDLALSNHPGATLYISYCEQGVYKVYEIII